MTLNELAGTRWSGSSELWLDAQGNDAKTSDCTIEVREDAIEYGWSFEGKPHTGRLALRAGGADFSDTFHSAEPMPCEAVAASWALVDVLGSYAAGDGPRWGWRIIVSHRPETDELVVQMTNIAPWGEVARGVRMVGRRTPAA